MGFGSRLLNLFSPKNDKGDNGGRHQNDNNDDELKLSVHQYLGRADQL